MIPAKDISKYQGAWQDTGEQIVMIKLGGGDDGLYFDPDCAGDYDGAKAEGRHVGCYWFIGWTAGASAESAFANKGMQPWQESDVIALDIENGSVAVPSDAPAYVAEMVDYIHTTAGVYPLLYMNLSTLNSHDWSGVLNNCGLWLADWSVAPTASIPTTATYVMQQYSDGPNYDHDEWFGTLDEFDAYGYHVPNAPVPTPPVVVPPAPVSTPVPSTPAPVVATPVTGTTGTQVTTATLTPPSSTTPKPTTQVPNVSWFTKLINAILAWWRSA